MPHTPDQRKRYNRARKLVRQAFEAGVPMPKILSMMAPMVGRSTVYKMLKDAKRPGSQDGDLS